jgi:hypothetical protein
VGVGFAVRSLDSFLETNRPEPNCSAAEDLREQRADRGAPDPLLGRWALQLIEDQLTMLPEFVETSFECLER